MILLVREWWSEWISRDNDVTTVLPPNQISALIRIFFGNAFRYVYFGHLDMLNPHYKIKD